MFKASCGSDTSPGTGDTSSKCFPASVSIFNTCSETGQLACFNESCCPTTLPFACPNAGCFATQAEALANCEPCAVCQGADVPVDQTEEQGSPQIDVTFDATGYNSKQCPAFWGKSCKALKTCCTTLNTTNAQTCVQSLNQALGDETSCTSYQTTYCPVLGTECKKAENCCDDFGPDTKLNCQNAVFNAHGAEPTCMSYQTTYCTTTPSCVELAACCAATTDASQRTSCEQTLISAANNDSSCTSYKTSYCTTN